VSGGIAGRDGAIPALADHRIALHDQCADRNLSLVRGPGREFERAPHPGLITAHFRLPPPAIMAGL